MYNASSLINDLGSGGAAGSVSQTALPVDSTSPSPSNLSLSSSSAPPREQASNFSSDGNGNAGPVTAGQVGATTSLSAPPPPRAPATEDDVSKLDLAIMACSIGLVVPMTLYIRDLTSGWETPWIVLYGVLLILSLASTVAGFFSALCPGVSCWSSRRLSPACARFGLVDAAALFVVFLACKLGRFGCAAGVGAAALVVLVLAVVWAWSEWPPRAPAVLGGAGARRPHGVP